MTRPHSKLKADELIEQALKSDNITEVTILLAEAYHRTTVAGRYAKLKIQEHLGALQKNEAQYALTFIDPSERESLASFINLLRDRIKFLEAEINELESCSRVEYGDTLILRDLEIQTNTQTCIMVGPDSQADRTSRLDRDDGVLYVYGGTPGSRNLHGALLGEIVTINGEKKWLFSGIKKGNFYKNSSGRFTAEII